MLFHEEIFIPKEYLSKAEYFIKSFNKYPYVLSKHLQERYELDRSHEYDSGITKILDELSSLDGYIFEIEVENSKVVKYCIRVKFDESQDICFAIMPKYKHNLIKTAWLNSNIDTHYTLDKSKYVDEKNYQITLQMMKKSDIMLSVKYRRNIMKTIEQIITDLENEFFFHHKKMKEYEIKRQEVAKKYGYNSLQYETYNEESVQESTLCLFIIQLLSDIKGIDEVEVECCLYHKFNLEGEYDE